MAKAGTSNTQALAQEHEVAPKGGKVTLKDLAEQIASLVELNRLQGEQIKLLNARPAGGGRGKDSEEVKRARYEKNPWVPDDRQCFDLHQHPLRRDDVYIYTYDQENAGKVKYDDSGRCTTPELLMRPSWEFKSRLSRMGYWNRPKEGVETPTNVWNINKNDLIALGVVYHNHWCALSPGDLTPIEED